MSHDAWDGWMYSDGAWVRRANPVTVFRDHIGWRVKNADGVVLQLAFAEAEAARDACDYGRIREVLPRFEKQEDKPASE